MAILRFLAILFFISSCSQLRDPIPSNSKNIQNFKAESFGVVLDLNDQIVDLDQISKKFTVLVFASDTCSTCLEEVTYWKTIVTNEFPSNIYFAHYLIGGFKQDILDWVEMNNVTWTVLYNSNDQIYKKYCSSIITPCFVIRNNETYETQQTYKILQKNDIERITGLWN